MKTEKIIREQITQKVLEVSNKKVRNIFFCYSGTDGKNIYCLVGNNGKIFGVAIVSNTLEIEKVII